MSSDRDGYDALKDWAAENFLTPREAVTILASAQTVDPSSVPRSLAWVPSAPSPHGTRALTAYVRTFTA